MSLKASVSSIAFISNFMDLQTFFRHFHPHIVFVEAVSVGVETCQLPTPILHLSASVHRRILLVAEDNTIAGLTLACAFTALATDRLFFVAFELSLATGETVNRKREVSGVAGRHPASH
jgi:hypothetical protein